MSFGGPVFFKIRTMRLVWSSNPQTYQHQRPWFRGVTNWGYFQVAIYVLLWKQQMQSSQLTCESRLETVLLKYKYCRCLPTSPYFMPSAISCTQKWNRTYTCLLCFFLVQKRFRNHIMSLELFSAQDTTVSLLWGCLPSKDFKTRDRTLYIGATAALESIQKKP